MGSELSVGPVQQLRGEAGPDAGDRADRRWKQRWVLVVTGMAVLAALAHRHQVHPDWLIARSAGRALFGHLDLAVYAHQPRAQLGPLALALALLPAEVTRYLVATLIAVPLLVCADLLRRPATRAQQLLLWAGGLPAVDAWTGLTWTGHSDDALVLVGAFGCVWGMLRGRRAVALAGCAVAFLGKPTAVALLAVTAPVPELFLAGGAIAAAIWLPFLLADVRGFLGAGRGIMPVGPDSLANLLGYRVGAPIPVWVRPVQLLLAPAAAVLGGLRGRPWDALLWVFAVRALVETNPAPNYAIPLVLLAIAADLEQRLPVALGLSALAYWLSAGVPAGAPGEPRLIALGLLVALLSARIFLGPRLAGPAGRWSVTLGPARAAVRRARAGRW
jgi:hypothetical protein